MKYQLSLISRKKIKNCELIKIVPEFYELKDIFENNDWHKNQSVFDHTLSVLEELEKLFKQVNKKVSLYLDQKVIKYRRKDLLFIAAVFHDIAKKETILKKHRLTSCPGHEKQGARKLNRILSRFIISGKEKKLIVEMVANHGLLALIVNSHNNKINKEFLNFKRKYSAIFLELVLLVMADILGSNLGNNQPDEFHFRIDFFEKLI